MKRYNLLYYFLVVLLIMGGLASMAQNSYGLKIIVGVSFAFGLSFLAQLIYQLQRKDHHDTSSIVELLGLSVLSFLLPLYLFQINIPFAEWIIVAAGLTVIFVYLQRMIDRYRLFSTESRSMSLLILIFHLSIILFILSIIFVSIQQRFSTVSGISALVLLVVFLAFAFFTQKLKNQNEVTTTFATVTRFRDRSVLLLSLFFIVSLYMIFTETRVLPRLYSDRFPQAYFELIKKAESGKDTLMNGRYRHQEFKDEFDGFRQRNITSN
jgi:hypothetical protein